MKFFHSKIISFVLILLLVVPTVLFSFPQMTYAAPFFTGGTVTTSGGYRIHTFTSSGTFTMVLPGDVEYLVVAGGGGGGRLDSASVGGGGGAGGMRTGTVTISSHQTITVGAGGAGATVDLTSGENGDDSSIGSLIVSTGGGGGSGPLGVDGSDGGSGGGGRGGGNGNGSNGGAGTVGQGNDGGFGDGAILQGNRAGGGGGGAGATGGNASAGSGGDGGNGSASSISGASVTYAGGGGGGDRNAGSFASGGTGGGGSGGGDSAGGDATSNTGGGGGGSGGAFDGGDGGSGIVIIRYALSAPAVDTNFAVTGLTSATLYGDIVSTGGESDGTTQHGFAYSTSATLSSGVSTTTLGTYANTGTFTNSISSLSNNTTYYFRAYATNSIGTGYGSIQSFTTGNTTTVSRRIHLFEGVTWRIIDNKIIINQM